MDRRNPANVSKARTADCAERGHKWKFDSSTCIWCGLHRTDQKEK